MKMYQMLRDPLLGPNSKSPKVYFFNHVELPVLRAFKEANDTVKPYKTFAHVAHDLLAAPFSGVGKILVGVVSLLSLLPGILALLIIPFMKNRGGPATEDFFKALDMVFTAAVINLPLGIAQIATWPLTILRIPLRGLITLVKGAPMIEDNPGMRALVSEFSNNPNANKEQPPPGLTAALIGKFRKAAKYGQKTAITDKELGDAIAADDVLSYEIPKINVIMFFKEAIEKRDREIAAARAPKQVQNGTPSLKQG